MLFGKSMRRNFTVIILITNFENERSSEVANNVFSNAFAVGLQSQTPSPEKLHIPKMMGSRPPHLTSNYRRCGKRQ